MAVPQQRIRNVYTDSDNSFRDVGHGFASAAASIFFNANMTAIQAAMADPSRYIVNLGALGNADAAVQISDRYINRRYNVLSTLPSTSGVAPFGRYHNGLIHSSKYYNNAGTGALESMNGGVEEFYSDNEAPKYCKPYNNDIIINYHTMPLEDYLSSVAPFSSCTRFVTSITLAPKTKTGTSGSVYVTDYSQHTEVDKAGFLEFIKNEYTNPPFVITGYDIIDYATREVLQSIDSSNNPIQSTTAFYDKCTRIPTSGWSATLNTSLTNLRDVRTPFSNKGYIQSNNWNNELLYSELVFPLACNATRMLGPTSSGYQSLQEYMPLVYASTAPSQFGVMPNYGHYFYAFKNAGDYDKWAASSLPSSTSGITGYGILGVWTLLQLDNYTRDCLGISYTVDDVIKATDGDPVNPPTGGEPGNPESSEPGSGDNTDDPIEPNVDFDPGLSTATPWLLTDSDLENYIKPFFFGAAFLSDANSLFKTGLNPFTAVYGLYRYNMSLGTLSELGIDQKEFSCMGIPIKLSDNTNLIQSYIRSASGMLNLNDGFRITRYFGNFLDYEPYTTMNLYIPYCGYKEIPCNMVYGNTIKIKLAVDWLSGYCTAFVTATDDDGNERLITSVEGTCGMQKVFCGVDYSTSQRYLLKGILGAFTNLAGFAVGGAIGGGAGSAITQGASKGTEAILGSPLQNVANAITAPPTLKTSGQVAESLQGYAPQDCCMYVERTMPALPGAGRTDFTTQADYVGKPAAYQGTVGSFKGFLSCSAIKGEINSAIITQEEKDMIYDYLRGGIYV